MNATDLAYGRAFACALAIFLAGCDTGSPASGDAACSAPDAAAPADAAVPPDTSPDVADSGADGAADDVADAAADVAAQDTASPKDVVSVDRAGFADAPLPDGIGKSSTVTSPFLMVTVTGGLLPDLEAALGVAPHTAALGIGDRFSVQQGYGDVDHVYMKGGDLTPETPGVAYPLAIYWGGHRTFSDEPARPADPDYATARTLFDGMTTVPETTTSEARFRRSPNGRVVCRMYFASDGAFCTFTGVISAHLF